MAYLLKMGGSFHVNNQRVIMSPCVQIVASTSHYIAVNHIRIYPHCLPYIYIYNIVILCILFIYIYISVNILKKENMLLFINTFINIYLFTLSIIIIILGYIYISEYESQYIPSIF